jgi:hypothetical protein
MNLNSLGMGKKLVDLVMKPKTQPVTTNNQKPEANKNEQPVQQDKKN